MLFFVTFRDHGGRTFSAATLDAPDDESAIEKARAIYDCGIGHSYEIHDRDRHVHTEVISTGAAKARQMPHLSSEEYLARARECQRMAQLTADAVLRDELLRLGSGCLEYAAHCAERESA